MFHFLQSCKNRQLSQEILFCRTGAMDILEQPIDNCISFVMCWWNGFVTPTVGMSYLYGIGGVVIGATIGSLSMSSFFLSIFFITFG